MKETLSIPEKNQYLACVASALFNEVRAEEQGKDEPAKVGELLGLDRALRTMVIETTGHPSSCDMEQEYVDSCPSGSKPPPPLVKTNKPEVIARYNRAYDLVKSMDNTGQTIIKYKFQLFAGKGDDVVAAFFVGSKGGSLSTWKRRVKETLITARDSVN